MNIVLWIVQILLGLAFLAAGIPKATQPIPVLAKRMAWVADVPVGLVRFIGVAEILGAIGLILPAVTHVLTWLTVAAAIGLALVMVCAVVFHIGRREFNRVAPGIVLFLLAAFVAYGRWKLAVM